MKSDADREKLFEILDRFRESLPVYDEAEVLADVDAAVRAVRRENRVPAAHESRTATGGDATA